MSNIAYHQFNMSNITYHQFNTKRYESKTNHYNGIFMGLTTVNAQSLRDFKPGKAGPKSLERPTFDDKNV